MESLELLLTDGLTKTILKTAIDAIDAIDKEDRKIGQILDNIQYIEKPEIVIIRNALTKDKHIFLHQLFVDAHVLAIKDKRTMSGEFQVTIDGDDRFVDRSIIDVIQDDVLKDVKRALNRSKDPVHKNILKFIDFKYDECLFIRYANNQEDWRTKKRKRNENLMDFHRDGWSTKNLTVSIGFPAKFRYVDPDKPDFYSEILINSGDIAVFDGQITEHAVTTSCKQCPDWFSVNERNDIYRYNLQFTKNRPRQSKRIRKLSPTHEFEPEDTPPDIRNIQETVREYRYTATDLKHQLNSMGAAIDHMFASDTMTQGELALIDRMKSYTKILEDQIKDIKDSVSDDTKQHTKTVSCYFNI